MLFIDLLDSTGLGRQLDPEVVGAVLDRYYRICVGCVTDHGGVIEKFIGDAVMAVFGIPASHEDDALRAARAAVAVVTHLREIRETEPAWGKWLRVRCGIGTGSVAVTQAADEDWRVVGDVVNLSSRLQAAGQSDDILVNAEAAGLLMAEAYLEPVGPLTLRGHPDPVPAWRISGLRAAARITDSGPFIGRHDQLSVLTRCLSDAEQGLRPTVAIGGGAGVGKSRLAREFLRTCDDREVLVLSGKCRSYGRGITFRPLADMISSALPGGWPQASAALTADGTGQRARDCLAAIVAVNSDNPVTTGMEDICWAAAQLLEGLARDRVLVLVWEDLQWAEPSLLRLITMLPDALPASQQAMTLLVGRAEPADMQCAWLAGIPGRPTVISLGPLGASETVELVTLLLGEGEVSAQASGLAAKDLAARCEGNPLFATLMADVIRETGVLPATLPATVGAVLSARIDALSDNEREALSLAATCGYECTEGELIALATANSTNGQVRSGLSGLVRHGLLARTGQAGGYRFVQNLVRESSYERASKASRAAWHELLAHRAAARHDASADEQAMMHSDAACQLYQEIRQASGPPYTAIASLASELLIRQGSVALHRKDMLAAIGQLERARELLDVADTAHVTVALRLCDAWVALGDYSAAAKALVAGEKGSPNAAGRRALAIRQLILSIRTTGGRPGLDEQLKQVSSALQEDPMDHRGWCELHQLRMHLTLAQGKVGEAESAGRRALYRAQQLGDRYDEDQLLSAMCEMLQWSPTPVADGLQLCEELELRFTADRLLLIPVLMTRARLVGISGNLVAAAAIVRAGQEYAAQLAAPLTMAAVVQADGLVSSMAGDHRQAGRRLLEAARMLSGQSYLSASGTLHVYAVREFLRSGEVSTAEREFRLLPEPGSGRLDARGELCLGMLRARLAATFGQSAVALATARQTLSAINTDDPCLCGDLHREAAVTFRLVNRKAEAALLASQARTYYRSKGASLLAAAVED